MHVLDPMRSFKLRLPAKGISQAAYEHKLEALITEFKQRVAKSEVRGKLRVLCDIIGDSDRPLTYYEIWERGGLTLFRDKWHIAGRLVTLRRRGLLEITGYHRRDHRGPPAACYRLVTYQLKRSAAIEWIDHQLDLLDAQRAVGACLATTAIPETLRDYDILQRRLNKESLQSIGDSYGITRERVRQIQVSMIRRKDAVPRMS
jgi:hypothetical protein